MDLKTSKHKKNIVEVTFFQNFGLAKLSTYIFLRPKIIQFKMEPSKPFIFVIFKSATFKFWILIED
jgi:hypothetical protein